MVVRKVARRIVEEHNFECIESGNGQDALSVCEDFMPDAILLDWNIPVMSGMEFLEKLRDMENGDHPKVLFCTTENDIKHIRRAVKAGANEYIMKPFDSDIVALKLQQVGLLEVTD